MKNLTKNIDKESKQKIIALLKEKADDLPMGFILGLTIGGVVFVVTRKQIEKTPKIIKKITKIAAPYVALSVLNKVGKK